VGVDSVESLAETLTGQRWIAVVGGVGLVVLMIAVVTRAAFAEPVGLATANVDSNPAGVAHIIFGDYIFPFELTAALLITAALGALVLSHRRRLGRKLGQKEMVEAKLAAFASGAGATSVVSAPGPGVYARTNSADMPAIDAPGKTLDASITTVLRLRGQVHRQADATAQTVRAEQIASGAPVIDIDREDEPGLGTPPPEVSSPEEVSSAVDDPETTAPDQQDQGEGEQQ